MQPRWLVSQLEELDYQSDYQVELINSLLYQSQSMNNLTQDYIGFAKADVFAVYELLQSLKQQYQMALEHAQGQKRRVDEQLDVATVSHKQSEDSLNEAHHLATFWTNQTNKAGDWLNRAQSALNDCERATSQARSELGNAERELSSARSQLSAARARPNVRVYIGDDSQGRAMYRYDPPDTSYEEGLVARATSRVNACQSNLNYALSQEKAARQERNKAQHQFSGSQLALNDANEAISMANQTLEVANDSKRQANYSQEFSQRCHVILDQVNNVITQFEQTYEQQSIVTSKLDSEANQAFLHLRNLESQQEAIQGEAFTLKYTLQDKTSLLIAFDQPLSSR